MFGIALGFTSVMGNSAMYRGMAVGSPSVVAVMTSLSPLIVVAGGYSLLGESLKGPQWATLVLIIAGVVLVRIAARSDKKGLQSLKWGLLAMLAFGINDLLSKKAVTSGALSHQLLAVSFFTGTLLLLIQWRLQVRSNGRSLDSERRTLWSATQTIGYGLGAGTINAIGLFLLLAAFQTGLAALVSAISSAGVILVVLYSRLFLGERLSAPAAAGITLVFCGIILLRLLS
ncbi:hypothetical protein KCTCHS21_49690 [Cohnella abietis]|uniref:EamA domain-containing protein n=1 Tax=Cohnella abietis TaxID=2507935 RepID=A0A3T1DBT3_9BACL|nr:hypothetical protein KCTCHS21_49690 [Cohnella abietis]